MIEFGDIVEKDGAGAASVTTLMTEWTFGKHLDRGTYCGGVDMEMEGREEGNMKELAARKQGD